MATDQFPSANGQDIFYLIEDSQIRQSYGMIIGSIAHSHHWNVDQLTTLPEEIGSIPGFPANWTVNPLKVAAILRCADASHIDHKRAPSMLFSLTKPTGISFDHWNFQNRILQPQVKDRKYAFSSGRPFSVSDATSWWLCYDAAKMINAELSSCGALLKSKGLPEFHVSGVLGAESPLIFCQYVKTDKWTPVNAEITVSNPNQVANTLGGKNLYGNNPFVAVRELVQNSCDAIRARRIVDKKDKLWGKVTVHLKHDEQGQPVIRVEDNGLGMSERVLTGPLLDFGKSYWSSAGMQDEFPVLMADGYRPTGKFGIGFFSVFMLGGAVEVISHSFTEGYRNSRLLDIRSINARPIIRTPEQSSLNSEISTSVEVRLSDSTLDQLSNGLDRSGRSSSGETLGRYFLSEMRTLTAVLDVHIEFNDEINGNRFSHRADWENYTNQEIVAALCGVEKLSPSQARLCDTFDRVFEQGTRKIVGFATMPFVGEAGGFPVCVSVNGFCYSTGYRTRRYYYEEPGNKYCGILDGETTDAARRSGEVGVSHDSLQEWASNQALRILGKELSPIESMIACHEVLQCDGNSSSLLFAYMGGKFLNFEEFESAVKDLSTLHIPLELGYSTELVSIASLKAAYLTTSLQNSFLCIVCKSCKLTFFGDRQGGELKEKGGIRTLSDDELGQVFELGSMPLLKRVLDACWGTAIDAEIALKTVFQSTFIETSSQAWVLQISRKSDPAMDTL